jgi:hypothetical protein
MNRLLLTVVMVSTVAYPSAREPVIPVTNQSVDSDKAKFLVWEHKGYALLFKKQTANMQMQFSPTRKRKKRYFLEPIDYRPLGPLIEVDRY